MADPLISTSLAALSRFLVGDGTVQDTLERVASITREAICSATMVGITMVVDGRPRTVVFTDPAVPEVDQVQFDRDEGPCLTAFREARTAEIAATGEPGDWPAFRERCAALGIGSVLSFPLRVDDTSLGALNLYGRHERAFSDDDRQTGALFAAQVAVVLANAQAYWDARDLSVRLGDAMRSRAIIEQAKAS